MLSQVSARQAGRLISQLAAVVALLAVGVTILSSGLPLEGSEHDNTRPWILDGQPIAAGEFPFLVSIWEELKDGPRHRCTGSLVGNNHIVTSARCIEDTANELTVKLGCSHLTRCKQEIDIGRVLVHPYYYLSKLKGRDQFDLAVLVTLESIDFSPQDGIMPIQMNTNEMDPRCKRQFMLVGIGKNASSGKETMLKFQASVVHPDECSGGQKVGKRTICVHSTTGNLPQQYLGSALIARPIGDGNHCDKQEAQLVGIVSSIRQNLLSTVTDMNATKEDLMNMIEGKPIKPDLPPGPEGDINLSDGRRRGFWGPGLIDGVINGGHGIIGRPTNPRLPIRFPRRFRDASDGDPGMDMGFDENSDAMDDSELDRGFWGPGLIDGVINGGHGIIGRPTNPRPPIRFPRRFRDASDGDLGMDIGFDENSGAMDDSELDRGFWGPGLIDGVINGGHGIIGRPTNPRLPIRFPRRFTDTSDGDLGMDMGFDENSDAIDDSELDRGFWGPGLIDGVINGGHGIIGRPTNPRLPIRFPRRFRDASDGDLGMDMGFDENSDAIDDSELDRRGLWGTGTIDGFINWGHKWFRSLETYNSPDG